MISTRKTVWVIHFLFGLPTMGAREWWKCYSGKATLTPANPVAAAEHHSVVLP